MTFNSYIFILAFLPVFVIAYLSLGKLHNAVSKALMILGGIIFYAYAGWKTTALFALSIFVNYLFACWLKKTGHKKGVLAIAIVLNIGLLGWFKYLNFAIETVNELFHGALRPAELILPLGISFFTFQQIMFVVSVARGEIDTKLADYLAYILYFPKLVMGPLMEPKDFYSQLQDASRKKVNWGNIAGGIKLFSYGFFKKMLLADTFAKAVSWGFANAASAATSADLFLVMLFYTFQIYFDFSGYSDMAVGISKMINIDLPMNFNSPYKATSIQDFWKRWHMSLTNFLTKYVYIPLGGSRKGQLRTYVNIMIVFLVSGIWHGASWTFILWGCLHGLLQILERLFKKWFIKLSEVVRWGYTFFSVNLLWLLFRADRIEDWRAMLKTMFRFQNMAVSDGLIRSFELPEWTFLTDKLHLTQMNADVRGFGMLLVTVAAFFICLVPGNNYKNANKTNALHMFACAIAFVWSFLCLSSESFFVYFNF